ncbi:MAG: DEAD/DEAH box helicase [Flavobacteriales bacterium]
MSLILKGIANTGTGKTAAFLVPLIQNLIAKDNNFQTLILVPTRELALQVEDEFKSLSKGLGLSCACFIGRTSVSQDISKLKKRNNMIIGTPGRLLDLINRRKLNLHNFSRLILDEFDRMLDMGFIDDVKKISKEQTMLFSATENKKQNALIGEFLNNPTEIKPSSGSTSAKHIDQDVVNVYKGEDKFGVLLGMVKSEEYNKVLIFAETKKRVTRIADRLKKYGIGSDEIHGDKSQGYRKKALNNFRKGKIKVLVATDVAARGIDVDDITHVINYQVPQHMDSYMHRIGRTGRAGKSGKALTLVDQ